MRCDGKFRLIDHNSTLSCPSAPSRVDVTNDSRSFTCGTGELVNHHLSAAAEREDEMEDGACCNVELACGLVVWHLSATEDEALLRRRNTG